MEYYAVPFKSHFKNYGTVGIGEPIGIRVLSRRSFPRSLGFFCFRCAMKIPVQSRQL
ncbi:hypothetical protein HanPI659440_Chr03g0102861 [Helianthus annuus]|nr:hypothetical protein HanPI659440_Chr03g0102861 [Helianthus annuus]